MPSSSQARSTSSESEQAAVVLVLHRDDVRDRLRRTQLVERHVREPDQPDLALVSQLTERTDRLLDRHLGIVAVQLVEIDAVELQPPQARLARAPQVFRAPVANSILQAPAEPALRRDHDTLRVRMKRFRDDLLADAAAVDVGGVDQRHAQLDRAPDDAHALLPVRDDAHRAEAEPAHLELAAEHEGRVHGCSGSPPASAER